MNEIRGLQLLCVKTYPFVGITRFRFHGYNLSLNKSSSTPHIDRKGKKKSGKCQTSAVFFALFKQKTNKESQSFSLYMSSDNLLNFR